MTEEQKEVAAHRLQRAHTTLNSAKVLLDAHHYLDTVNRLYYACFYAVTALLETRDLSSSKHSGVLSLFNRHFVKTGIIQAELGEFYNDLYEKRHEGDYTDFIEFTQERVSEMYESAAGFVDEFVQLIEKEMQK